MEIFVAALNQKFRGKHLPVVNSCRLKTFRKKGFTTDVYLLSLRNLSE